MSAYGAIQRASRPTESPLGTTIWHTQPKSDSVPARSITIHHLTLNTAAALSGLISALHKEFAEEVARGTTYPQETLDGGLMTREVFEAYFFAADVFVGVVDVGASEGVGSRHDHGGEVGIKEISLDIETARAGRSWEDCIPGFYYVKPNYPGRSSHICNAGFITPNSQRGKGFGALLAHSYLHYGPALGYKASVFNLVFVNNVASIRLWDALGFTKVGRIPQAGRLRSADGHGEEYVDAWVIYKDFSATVSPLIGKEATG